MTQRDDLVAMQTQLDAALLENVGLKLQVAELEKQVLQKAVTDLTAQVSGLGAIPVSTIIPLGP